MKVTDQDGASDSKTFTVSVTKADQATLTVTSPDAGTYGDKLVPTASGGSGDGAVSFTATGAACEMGTGADAGKLLITSGTGTCSITAHKAADNNYNAASSALHPVTVSKKAQTISFTAPASAVFESTFHVAPTASSGLSVSLASTGGCSVAPAAGGGFDVTMTSGTTDCVLTASQAGNDNYLAATDVVETVEAAKKAQAISVRSACLLRRSTTRPSWCRRRRTSGLSVSLGATGGSRWSASWSAASM